MSTARSTDPMTSRLARKSETLEAEVMNAIVVAGPLIAHEIVAFINKARHENGDKKRQIDISCVSNIPIQLIRDGKIHVSGWKINPDTGNKCEQYAQGARPGDGSAAPAVSTGPRRKKGLAYEMFLPTDVIQIMKDVMASSDQHLGQVAFLTERLNKELKARVS